MRRLTLALAAVMLALAVPSTARAYQLEQDPTGAQVRWSSGLTLYVDPGARSISADQVMAAVQRAAAHWADAAGVKIDVQQESSHGQEGYQGQRGDNRSEVIFVEDEWEGDSDAVATTLITTDTSTHEIVDADILVNEAEHHFAILPDDAVPGQGLSDDLEGTLTHELGHALGLAHNKDLPEATMYPSTVPGETSKRKLNPDDVQGAQALYGTASAPKGDVPSTGCQSGVGSDGALALLAVLLMLGARRLRKAAIVAAVAIPALAFAEPPVTHQLEGDVVATHSYWKDGRIYTDVEVAVTRCNAGDCQPHMTFRQPGGTVGHLSQQLGDLQVPPAGAHVEVRLGLARDGALRLLPGHRAATAAATLPRPAQR